MGLLKPAGIARLCGTVALLPAALICPAQQSPAGAAQPTFQVQSRLVLLPFRVLHGRNYVTSLKQSDVILLEDGKPRPFTIFDTPTSQARLPVELALLFDTTPKVCGQVRRGEYCLWDPDDVFRFITQWDDGLSRAILQTTKDQVEVRISVYRAFGQKLYRMARPTTDPHVVTAALQSILLAMPAQPEPGAVITLALPPGRDRVEPGPFTNEYITSPFAGGGDRGWTMEAAMGLLNEVSAAQDRVARVLVMFSEGIGATTTVPEDVGNQALDLGIPIYPIAPNYKDRIRRYQFPRNYFRMHEFEALGKMTGGRASEYTAIDAKTLRAILDGVVSDALAQYVVGFVPAQGEDAARQHRLEIRLSSKSAGAIQGGKRRAVYQ
jgi:VWFA-related protein